MKPELHTFSGKIVNPLDLKLEDITTVDIAHALALCNRFAGHTKFPISVAQHSVFVARLCWHTPFALQALLHDASETYLGDVTKWVKQTPEMAGYRSIEERVTKRIFERYGCPTELAQDVEIADRIMVRFEGYKGYGEHFSCNHPNYPPLTKHEIDRVGKWSPWSWEYAEKIFLAHFRKLHV